MVYIYSLSYSIKWVLLFNSMSSINQILWVLSKSGNPSFFFTFPLLFPLFSFLFSLLPMYQKYSFNSKIDSLNLRKKNIWTPVTYAWASLRQWRWTSMRTDQEQTQIDALRIACWNDAENYKQRCWWNKYRRFVNNHPDGNSNERLHLLYYCPSRIRQLNVSNWKVWMWS